MKPDEMQLQMLNHLRRYGESSTKQIAPHFPEFEDRKSLSAFLGNLNREGLIAKNNPGQWSLTSIGRSALEDSGYPFHCLIDGAVPVKAKDDISEPVTVVADWEQAIRDTSRKAENDAMSPFDMARQLQHEIPNGSSLVIEADEVFLAWRGARFSIQKPEDLQAFKAIQEAYIGEVA